MNIENTPALETKRLLLRKFTPNDVEALYTLLSDEEVNAFLPWFPLKSLEEAYEFYETRYAAVYRQPYGYSYAVCLKTDPLPIGYVNIKTDNSHDLGYGLRKEFWHKGITTEASKAIAAQAKKDGLLYITATHDINNPRSGAVMKQLGMEYKYSYVELVQPKQVYVTFRLYQLNFDGEKDRVYTGYCADRFVEKGV